MTNQKVAKRYAKGLAGFTNESGTTELLLKEMQLLITAIDGSNELRVFFKSPIIDKKKKIKISEVIFKDYSVNFKTFISFVINHGREFALKDIATYFVKMVNNEKGIYKASLTTASVINEAVLDSILSVSKTKLGITDQLEVDHKIDPEILGGFIIRIEDKEIDSSIKSKLDGLRKNFSENHYEAKI